MNMKKIFSIILSLCLFNSVYGATLTTDCGNIVSITATPAPGYHFTQWQDGNTENPRQVEVKASNNYIASFAPNDYTLTLSGEHGVVSGAGSYEYGSVVTISATPFECYRFKQWSDGNTNVTREITITDNIELEAIFEVITYTITIESANQEQGTVTIEVVGTQDDTPSAPSQGIGVFSVSATKSVTFSPGNLQYTQSTNTWSFASTQYETLGADNVIGGTASSDSEDGDYKDGTALADKMDLFGWSTTSTYFGVSTSENDDDYYGSFVDWGTNQIGSDAPNTWRTLTDEEWGYLKYNRPNASSLQGVAQVNGVNGLVLLPDNWTCPAGITFKSGYHNNHSVEAYGQHQTFTADQWSKLEAAGAIFLPVTGVRNASSVSGTNYSYYWSASEIESNDEGGCCCFIFYSEEATVSCGYPRLYGMSVRLVKDL